MPAAEDGGGAAARRHSVALRRLLIRPGAIGDCIVSLPSLESLRTDYTEVWAPAPVVPLMRFASRAESIASTGLDQLELPDRLPPPRLVERLQSFDSIVSWYGANRRQFRQRVAELGLPFQFFPPLPARHDGHAVEFYLQQVQTLKNGAVVSAVPRVPCCRTDAGFAAIHPFSGSPGKNWPLHRYRELAARLERKLPVRWCAGPEDNLDEAVRIGDLYELACWLAGARVFIGNDSGVSHLAAAAGAPVVALFGPTDPGVWAPRGERVSVVKTGPQMIDISVGTVMAAVCEVLG